MIKETLTFGLIVGTRGVFNSQLATSGRQQLIVAVEKMGFKTIILPVEATPTGAVETFSDGRKCAELFEQHRKEIDGIIISLPNFGDELGIVNALSLANLKVPVLVQASPDELDQLGTRQRRDAFCGKISVCNNLRQYGIPYSLTATHTVALGSEAFANDLLRFAATCRVVMGLRNARFGAIGARPAAFQTVRFSEKIMQASGITVVPLDLSELIASANQMDVTSSHAKERLEAMQSYGTVKAGIRNLETKWPKHLRLYLAIEEWMHENYLDAATIQCWTSIQKNYGCATCLTMSMLSNSLIPCACEVDVAGVLSMYALSLATLEPTAIVDWNNNYADEPNKCVAQHCGNYPERFVGKKVEVDNLSVLGTTLGEEVCFGAINAKVEPGPMTYLRISTDDVNGKMRGYVGEGQFTDDPFNMLGSIAVCAIPNMQKLFKTICDQGFEHHAAMVRTHVAPVIAEAASKYLGWDMILHE
jgi:L-fucose isomerase-like protein